MLKKRGLLIVISGPSGAGKGTICKEIVSNLDNVQLSVSATTRKPRVGEVDKVNYFFKTKEEFEKMIENKELFEYAGIYGNFYGTPRAAIEKCLEEGTDVILEIEMQGAMQVKELCPEAVFVFILPPSLEELKRRIVGRATETEDQITKRFNSAYNEIKLLGDYDYFVFNNVVEKSADEIKNIIIAEKNKVHRYKTEVLEKFEEEMKTC